MIRRIPASPIAAVMISVALLGASSVPEELDPQDFHPATPSASATASPAAESSPSLHERSATPANMQVTPAPQASTGALSAATTGVPAAGAAATEVLRPLGALPLIAVTPLPTLAPASPLPKPAGSPPATPGPLQRKASPALEGVITPPPTATQPPTVTPPPTVTQPPTETPAPAVTMEPSVTSAPATTPEPQQTPDLGIPAATSDPAMTPGPVITLVPNAVPAAQTPGAPAAAASAPVNAPASAPAVSASASAPAVTAAPIPAATPAPPVSDARTPVPAPQISAAIEDPITEKFWGASVVDRYRYLENFEDERTKAFFEVQGDAAAQYLKALNPARTRLFDRIRELDRSSVSVGGVMRVYNTYFYERQDPTDETSSLFMRTADGRLPKLLVNPTLEKHGKTHFTIDWVVPAPNARFVAFGLSSGGSEESVLHIVDTKTGKRLPDAIDRTRFGASGWLPDSASVIYTRLPKTTAKTPVVDRERFLRSYIHRIGRPVADDRAIFGWKVDAKIPFAPDDVPNLSVTPGSKYIVAAIGHGVQNELTIYAAPYAQIVSGGAVTWKKIVDVPNAVTSFDVHGSDIYLLSHKNASNYRVMRAKLDGSGKLQEVVKPGRAVIQQIGIARDGLYLRVLDGGIGRVAKIALTATNTDALTKTVALPYDGSITSIVTDPRVAGVTFGLTGWTHSLLWYRTDGAAKLADTALKPISPVDASGYTSTEVTARSSDGTEIPLSIIMKKGTVLDGSHPTYLQGYGAYGQTLSPYFSTTRIAWLERGGVYAVAHVRGGGEFGEDWHKAAMRAKKKRSIEDFIACAKYLIANKYTSPQFLGAEGTSAGGIVVGGAITHAPQLFAGVLDVVGVSNALRSEFSANGPGNIPEFGTVKNRDEFFTLYDIDAVAQVKNGTAYPGVLLITGLNDPRVPSWELGKFAARLQKATTSGKPVLLRIDRDAGHGFLAASRTQSEELLTDEYAFLLEQMGLL